MLISLLPAANEQQQDCLRTLLQSAFTGGADHGGSKMFVRVVEMLTKQESPQPP